MYVRTRVRLSLQPSWKARKVQTPSETCRSPFLSTRLILLAAGDSCARISMANDLQITSDLSKYGVNTGPPISEYEGFILRNSVNPMP